MAEAGADVHRAVGRPMHEFDGNEIVAGKLEHGQAGAASEVNLTNPAVPDSRVESQGGVQVCDAERRVQSPHYVYSSIPSATFPDQSIRSSGPAMRNKYTG